MASAVDTIETSEDECVPDVEGGDTTDARPDRSTRLPVKTNSKKEMKQPPASSAKTEHRVVAQPYLYNMNYAHVGKCVIINNKNFQGSTEMDTRRGTSKDAQDIQTCFQNLGFQVSIKKDQTCEKIKALLRKVAEEDHSDNACFACVLLSHGEAGCIYGTDGMIEIKDLTTPFRGDRCRSLVGKPKLFFIQACRGQQLDTGIEADAASDSDSEEDETSPKNKIPVEADFLLAYSTVEGYYAWRNEQHGSWFIQSLSKVLTEHGRQLEIMQILTRVNFMVATGYESEQADPYYNNKKQMPCITSMLTKELYFQT
ncbi:caspase-7-like [Lissotriton helveticus]